MKVADILTVGVAVAIVGSVVYARSHPGEQVGHASAGPVAENVAAVAVADDVIVYKSEFCGCCMDWVKHLEHNGFGVNVINVTSTQPVREKLDVPPRLNSCHTARVGDYWVEGHVPADIIERLLTEKPSDIRGVAVPGMPQGSPGMEGPNPVSYRVVAHMTDGSISVLETREGRAVPDY